MGCVGDDEFAQKMTATASKDGVNVSNRALAVMVDQHCVIQPNPAYILLQQCLQAAVEPAISMCYRHDPSPVW
jgi:hypothetical protein